MMPQTAGKQVKGYRKITTLTPSDTVPVPGNTQALYIQGTGNLSVQMQGAGTPFLFTAVPAGTILNIAPTHVRATGTTATNITAMG
jgi:hypothetical protein